MRTVQPDVCFDIRTNTSCRQRLLPIWRTRREYRTREREKETKDTPWRSTKRGNGEKRGFLRGHPSVRPPPPPRHVTIQPRRDRCDEPPTGLANRKRTNFSPDGQRVTSFVPEADNATAAGPRTSPPSRHRRPHCVLITDATTG